MGVTLYHCKFCNECLHQDYFANCDCCQDNIYHSGYNMVCDQCIKLKRFEKNYVTLTGFEYLGNPLICDKCIKNEDMIDFDEILNCDYFKKHPKCTNDKISYDQLLEIIKLHKNRYFNANNEKYKETLRKLINILEEIIV
jgi:hypothetical protein